jgi:hypothetical protein
MNELRISQQPAPEEPVLAEVLELYPNVRGRIVGVARPMQVGRGAVQWPPPVPQPDDDDGPTAA